MGIATPKVGRRAGIIWLAFLSIQATGFNATFTVTTTEDTGPGTLRQAILDSNRTPGTNTIAFNLEGPVPATISPLSALPTISRAVIIDGTTQPGFAGRPVIGLDGSNAGSANGLHITSGNTMVRGLAIYGFFGTRTFSRAGIFLEAGGRNTIAGNFIGPNLTGLAALENLQWGIIILNSANNVIGGTNSEARNVISGNAIYGVHIEGSGASGNRVQGNFIGTDVSGSEALGNAFIGVFINNAANNTIGGTNRALRNSVSGNRSTGVQIAGAGATGNKVQANLIGTDANGAAALANEYGVAITGGASNNTIGGGDSEAGNVISGNDFDGVFIFGPGSTSRNRVEGNLIGTDATGLKKLGNAQNGVRIDAVASNTIGGTNAAARNVISGNGSNGIEISSRGATRNLIQGNLIGTDILATGNLGNASHGVLIISNAPNNVIGGTLPEMRNVIAFNGGDGVSVETGTGNAIRGNAIFGNADRGIDLGADGASANDAGDADTGANNLQNFPLLTSAVSEGQIVSLRGTLDSTANSTNTIDFYSNGACSATGFGEGQNFLGSVIVNNDGQGNGTFEAALFTSVAAGQFISATVTDASGNTSEFSPCVTVSAGVVSPRLSLARSGTAAEIVLSWPATFSGFVLETTENLSPPVRWSAVTNVPTASEGRTTVRIDPVPGNRFYRIRSP